MAARELPRSSSVKNSKQPPGLERRANSIHALLKEPAFFVRILHSQGKFATSSSRNRMPLPQKLRSNKIKRLAGLNKLRKADERQALAGHLLSKRNLPFEREPPCPEEPPTPGCNAKRVKEERPTDKSLLFRSARRYAHFELFEREEEVFAGLGLARHRLRVLRGDDDCDSSEADVHSGVNKLRESVLCALRSHPSPRRSSQSSKHSAESADSLATRCRLNPFKGHAD